MTIDYDKDYVEADKMIFPYYPPVFWQVGSGMTSSYPKPNTYAEDTWHTVNMLTDLDTNYFTIPDVPDMQLSAVRVDGILVITAGTTPENIDLFLHFRTTGDPENRTYRMQLISKYGNNGQRNNGGLWLVPNAEGCIDMKWRRTTIGNLPSHPNYGFTLLLNAVAMRSL